MPRIKKNDNNDTYLIEKFLVLVIIEFFRRRQVLIAHHMEYDRLIRMMNKHRTIPGSFIMVFWFM